MTVPLRVNCTDENAVPSLAEIRRLVTREQHLVLQFPLMPKPRAFDKSRLITELRRHLPECSVFDSGGNMEKFECITIKQVIATHLVLAHAEAFVSAARQFRRTAHTLIFTLAMRLNVPIDALSHESFRFSLTDDQYQGQLDDEWQYGFHGFECRFHNVRTGQTLDVKLGFPNEWGVLDPYFFSQFLRTTPEFLDMAYLLEDDYHDTSRIICVLEQQGLFQRVHNAAGNQSGSVVTE